MSNAPMTSPAVPGGAVDVPTETRRVVSVDALRGFDMFWILGGDSLAQALKKMSAGREDALGAAGQFAGNQLEHVDWEGFRFYDLIFPLFVFIVGVSLVFSLTRLLEREGKAAAHGRVFRRFALLFVLALIYSGGVSKLWPDIRLLGVLNRIALCYLFASLLFLNFRLRGLIIACVSLLAGYWALMTFVPVPEIGAGSFAKGANLANWIDSQYLPGKRYDGTWDPEGLLSTLPAIATCLLGVFAGLLLKDTRVRPERRSLWLVGAGAAMVALGWLWGLQFPVIKKIWTSSYVLVAGGYSAMLLGLFHYIVDVRGQQRWATAFIWIGANAITLYFADSIIGFEKLAQRLVGGDVAAFLDRHATTGMGHLVAAGVGLVLATALARFLYRRKLFLRV
jgi:predicted acyltransferase